MSPLNTATVTITVDMDKLYEGINTLKAIVTIYSQMSNQQRTFLTTLLKIMNVYPDLEDNLKTVGVKFDGNHSDD